jgi:hypothetical protein
MESETESVNVLGVTQGPAISPIHSTPEPGCSTSFNIPEIDRRPCTPRESIFTVASPQQIMPFPVTQKTVRITKKRGKTAIITASPYKNELEETIKKKEAGG